MNLEKMLENIEKFKQPNTLEETRNQEGFIYDPLSYKNRNYGFMVFSEEKYNPYINTDIIAMKNLTIKIIKTLSL